MAGIVAITSGPSMGGIRLSSTEDIDAARVLVEVVPSRPLCGVESAQSDLTNPEASDCHFKNLKPVVGDGHINMPDLSMQKVASTETGGNLQSAPLRDAKALAWTNCGGLDALATLASREQESAGERPLASFLVTGAMSTSSSDDDSEAMPPPPPRRRPRSVSNPEGMEKWDSLKQQKTTRRHFVLPASILEEELEQASKAVEEHHHAHTDEAMTGKKTEGQPLEEADFHQMKEELDEENISPEEMLRRARSRLLEDLSQSTVTGDKGDIILPHSLAKYRNVYNRNGRIGIYTPAERAAIIARFKTKRNRRVWNKKIRYNCRKSLADRRLRIKGRFVKRSEQEQLAKQLVLTRGSGNGKENESEHLQDNEMPDVSDPEANFAPTEDQPYRRLRRHTIT